MGNKYRKVRFTKEYRCNDGKIVIPKNTFALYVEGEENYIGLDQEVTYEIDPATISEFIEDTDNVLVLSNKKCEVYRKELHDVFFKSFDYYIGLRNFITGRKDSFDNFTMELYSPEHKKSLDEIINRMNLKEEERLALYYRFQENCSQKESAENAGITTSRMRNILNELSIVEFSPLKFFAIGEYSEVINDEEWVKNLLYRQKKDNSYDDHGEDLRKCDIRILYYMGIPIRQIKPLIELGINNIGTLIDTIGTTNTDINPVFEKTVTEYKLN